MLMKADKRVVRRIATLTEEPMHRRLTTHLAMLAVLAASATLGCGEDESEPAGHRGEFCLSRGDCTGGLACFSNKCTDANFNLKVEGKECVAIECRVAKDCCPEPTDPALCANYKQNCALYPDAGACELYEDAYCECDPDRWSCQDDKCVEQCEDVGERCANGWICNGKRCIQCEDDDDCSADQKCVDDVCQSQCKEDLDCPVFHSCESKKCTYTGCGSDRECVAYRQDLRAYCDEEKKCQVPCSVDLECDDPYSFESMACVDGLCINIGCESDEECRIRLGLSTLSSALGMMDAVCRTKTEAAEED